MKTGSTQDLIDKGGYLTQIYQRNSVYVNWGDTTESGEPHQVWHATLDEAMDWLMDCEPFNRARIEYRPEQLPHNHHYGVALYEIEPEAIWLCDLWEGKGMWGKTWKGKRAKNLGHPRDKKFGLNCVPTSLEVFAHEKGIRMEMQYIEDMDEMERWLEKVSAPKRLKRLILRDEDSKWMQEAHKFGVQVLYGEKPPYYLTFCKGSAHECIPPTLDEVLDCIRSDISYWMDERGGYEFLKAGGNGRLVKDVDYACWREYKLFEDIIDELLAVEYYM